MEKFNFKYYEKKPCKFILRSGKEVFGIVWEEDQADSKKYFFSSAVQYMKAKIKSSDELKQLAYPITLDELIHAELLG
ncbi:MAG: hypothetical protein ACJAZ2_000343 [Glaciecola sp.]|jgi:hypothetical protein